jgi:hypothetical protein
MRNVSYSVAREHILEGDILLYRGVNFYSRFLKMGGESPYTHVAIASWHNDILECVEFHEKYGGRTVSLEQYNKLDKRDIEVYRPTAQYTTYEYGGAEGKVIGRVIDYDGQAVTNCMRGMTSLPYGWKRIWWLAKHKMVGFRLFVDQSKLMDDDASEVIYPVCSTALSACISKTGYDIVKNRADQWTEPGDFGRSTLLSYLFTITKD